MVNAWSLLYDELKMSENFETTYESSIPKELPYPFDDETKQSFLELYDKIDVDFVMPVDEEVVS
jgi:hypothetical protein